MHASVPLTVPAAFHALSGGQQIRCVKDTLARIIRIRNHHQKDVSRFELDDPKEYLDRAWHRLAENSQKFDLGTPSNIAAIIATTVKHIILEDKRAIYAKLKQEEEFQERPDPELIFGIDGSDPAAKSAQAFTKLKQVIEDDQTTLARLAVVVIDLVIESFNEDGESPYVHQIRSEGRRELRPPRLDLDRREIASVLGIDPTRVSKVKRFIRQMASQSEELSFWQLLRLSDEDEADEAHPADLSSLCPDQISTPLRPGGHEHD